MAVSLESLAIIMPYQLVGKMRKDEEGEHSMNTFARSSWFAEYALSASSAHVFVATLIP